MHNDGVGNYWFYHKGSFPTDEPLLYKQLVGSATSYVEIWDPYYNTGSTPQDCDIFDLIQDAVTIKILTLNRLGYNSTYLSDVKNELKMKIPASKNVRFGLRVFNIYDPRNHEDWFFHDRLLIIDQIQVFIVGSSVGYHTKSKKS